MDYRMDDGQNKNPQIHSSLGVWLFRLTAVELND